jgi:hypothetical protein
VEAGAGAEAFGAGAAGAFAAVPAAGFDSVDAGLDPASVEERVSRESFR